MNPVTEPLLASLRDRLSSEPLLAGLDLMSIVRPSVRLTTQRVPQDQIAIGESRIGGVPDAPPGFEWPRWMPIEKTISWFGQPCATKPRVDRFGQPWPSGGPAPLGFIAQFDLSAISRVDDSLPSSGWLYFFYDGYCETRGYDPSDRGSCRVIYANCERSALLRTETPSDADPEHIAESSRIEASPELTLPYYLPELIPNFEYNTAASTFENIENTPEYAAFKKLCDELMPGGEQGLHHRLFGYPQIVQNPMEIVCQLASNGVYCGDTEGFSSERRKGLESGAADWRLLLQIDTDEEGPGWMWGDCGKIYFWIKQHDLKSLRFDDAWLILQCS